MTASPPLLALAEGRRVRARKPTVVRPKEIELHMPIADVLRRFCKPGWRWAHYPAGEHRDARTGTKLRAMGVQRGWPDLILFNPCGALHALELKRRGAKLSADQEDFRKWCGVYGVPYSVATSVDEAMAVLVRWGALRIVVGGSNIGLTP